MPTREFLIHDFFFSNMPDGLQTCRKTDDEVVVTDQVKVKKHAETFECDKGTQTLMGLKSLQDLFFSTLIWSVTTTSLCYLTRQTFAELLITWKHLDKFILKHFLKDNFKV